MKLIASLILSLLPLVPASLPAQQAQQPPKEFTEPIYEPKASLDILLTIVAQLAKKRIVVTDEAVLGIETSLVLPAPVSYETTRRAIDAVLLLEGYALIPEGDELHLRKVLTDGQRDALNEALGRKRETPPQSVSGRAVQPVPKPRGGAKTDWIEIRKAE